MPKIKKKTILFEQLNLKNIIAKPVAQKFDHSVALLDHSKVFWLHGTSVEIEHNARRAKHLRSRLYWAGKRGNFCFLNLWNSIEASSELIGQSKNKSYQCVIKTYHKNLAYLNCHTEHGLSWNLKYSIIF